MKATERDQAEAVQRMLDHLERHPTQAVSLRELADAAGYSPWYASRLFQKWMGLGAMEYARARRLAHAALFLRDGEGGVLETAVRYAFGSHEGFTRAFTRTYRIVPSDYAETKRPVPLCMPRSARLVFEHGQGELTNMPTQAAPAIFVHLREFPARRLAVVRGTRATDYWSYCEELGCDVWGLLLSIPGTLDEPKGLWLPEALRPANTSTYVMGVELPSDFAGVLPAPLQIADLAPASYLVFQGPPYDEADMTTAIAALRDGMERYDPAPLGFVWDEAAHPRYQLAPMGERGVIEARPVRRRG